MDRPQALETIRYFDKMYRRGPVRWIFENYETAKPTLLEYIREGYENPDDEFMGHIYAMYIMAQLQDRDAFEPLVRYLSLDEDDADMALGDTLLDDFPRILASVMHAEDLPALQECVKDTDNYLYCRDCALNAAAIAYMHGKIDRERLIETTRLSLLNENFEDDGEFFEFVLKLTIDTNLYELYDEFSALYDENKEEMPGEFVDDEAMDELKEALDLETAKNRFMEERYHRYISDVDRDLGMYGCFEENRKKFGRNDPCPCGSGMKYKKCCGA